MRIIFLILIVIVFFPILSCSKSKKTAEQSQQSQKTADVYTCPMHPQIKKDSPGQCPICGMTLVKVETTHTEAQGGEAPDGHAAFSLSEAKRQMIGVKLGVVSKKPLFKSIHVAGRLAFDPELYAAQNEYIEAVKQVESVKNSPVADVRQSSERMLDAAKLRLKILGLSDVQIKNLAAGDFNDARLLLKTGGSSWVYAEVFEMDLPLVHPGLSAEISARFLGGQVVAGKVVSIDRIINPATRTAKARILVNDVRSLLRPESYVDVNILAPLGEQITVPFDAVLDTGKQAWVFVADNQGKFEPRLVTIKFHVGSEAALASGVKEGEQIVTSANFLIDSESRLKGVLMSADATGADKKAAPSCPEGQHWDGAMKMCM
ncbi:MAG: efflux RND transporter periplasmic adaptor subunit [Deltaproteobacteria bacterium]|nr:efflux RND transporter periplasmic adaptor subunit [Deltaproteobacteria bacterium]